MPPGCPLKCLNERIATPGPGRCGALVCVTWEQYGNTLVIGARQGWPIGTQLVRGTLGTQIPLACSISTSAVGLGAFANTQHVRQTPKTAPEPGNGLGAVREHIGDWCSARVVNRHTTCLWHTWHPKTPNMFHFNKCGWAWGFRKHAKCSKNVLFGPHLPN